MDLPMPPGWSRQHKPAAGEPHGWIQWKGTDVCMDVRCVCGSAAHVDAEFAYYVRCPACGRIYMANGHIELVELTTQEKTSLQDETPFSVVTGVAVQ